jgi:T4-like virus tail tube protein gp19
MMPIHAYAAGKFAVDVDNAAAGLVLSVEGGHATAPVINERPGPDKIVHKHIGPVQFEDITIVCGTGMSKGFYEWIKAALDRKPARLDGAIHYCDYDGNIVSTLEWQKGLISEVGFPASDAAAKEQALMTIRIAPKSTRQKKASGKIDLSKYASVKQQRWLSSNFRLSIQGCEEACKRVNRIDAFSIKQQILDYPSGEQRDYEKEPGNLEVPNLVLTMAESHADEFYNWHRSFVIEGRSGQDQEKTGLLEYLSQDLKSVLLTLNFAGLGIFKLTPEKVEAGSENIRRIKAEMYCESIQFNPV